MSVKPEARKRGDERKKERFKTGANAKRGRILGSDARSTGGLG